MSGAAWLGTGFLATLLVAAVGCGLVYISRKGIKVKVTNTLAVDASTADQRDTLEAARAERKQARDDRKAEADVKQLRRPA